MEKPKEKKPVCPKCGSTDNQIKHGTTSAGSQRLSCKKCNARYTPIKKSYSEATKKNAVKAYLAGNSARKVGRMFGIDGNTVTAWVNFYKGSSAIRQSVLK